MRLPAGEDKGQRGRIRGQPIKKGLGKLGKRKPEIKLKSAARLYSLVGDEKWDLVVGRIISQKKRGGGGREKPKDTFTQHRRKRSQRAGAWSLIGAGIGWELAREGLLMGGRPKKIIDYPQAPNLNLEEMSDEPASWGLTLFSGLMPKRERTEQSSRHQHPRSDRTAP